VGDGRLHADADQAARPVERNPGHTFHGAVDGVAAADVVGFQVAAVVYQELNDRGAAFVRGAVQGGAALVVGGACWKLACPI
jgi:hypothetical protein